MESRPDYARTPFLSFPFLSLWFYAQFKPLQCLFPSRLAILFRLRSYFRPYLSWLATHPPPTAEFICVAEVLYVHLVATYAKLLLSIFDSIQHVSRLCSAFISALSTFITPVRHEIHKERKRDCPTTFHPSHLREEGCAW